MYTVKEKIGVPTRLCVGNQQSLKKTPCTPVKVSLLNYQVMTAVPAVARKQLSQTSGNALAVVKRSTVENSAKLLIGKHTKKYVPAKKKCLWKQKLHLENLFPLWEIVACVINNESHYCTVNVTKLLTVLLYASKSTGTDTKQSVLGAGSETSYYSRVKTNMLNIILLNDTM